MSQPSPRNPFFPLTVLFGAAFVVTILALVAAIMGDPAAPLAQLLDRYAGRLIAGEVGAILITGFLALAVDRHQSRSAFRRQQDRAGAEG